MKCMTDCNCLLLILLIFGMATGQNDMTPKRLHDLEVPENHTLLTSLKSKNESKFQTDLPRESEFSVSNLEPSCPSFKQNLDSLTQEQFLSILMDECRYDKVTRPDTEGPLNVSVQMDVKHIDATEQQEFKMHMLLNFRYTDYRLKYDTLSPNRRLVVGDDLLRKRIWVPHILLMNEKQSALMGLEAKDIFITISPQGEVTFSCRLNVVIYCWMNLKKFPFDKQKCTMSFRSWTYNASSIILNWDNGHPVGISKVLHMTQFSLERYSTYSQIDKESSFDREDNYSTITFEFVLSRQVGYYMLDFFIPSGLLVAATWGTFWLQADNAPARTTLGTSPMLAFITLAQGQNRALPKVSYVKASDIWFLMCALFISASMLEFFFVNVIWRRKKQVDVKKVNIKHIMRGTLTPNLARKELELSNLSINRRPSKETVALYSTFLTVGDFGENQSPSPSQSSQTEDDVEQQLTIPIPTSEYDLDPAKEGQQWTTMSPQEVSIWIDRRARVVFPCAFFICNIFYWMFVYVL